MEFSSLWYFSFWSLISIVFSSFGIYALHMAAIPGSTFLELCFPLWVGCSISCAFLFRPALDELDHPEFNDEPRNKILIKFYLDAVTVCAPAILLPDEWNSVSGILQLVSTVMVLSSCIGRVILGVKRCQTIGNFFTGFVGPLRMYPYYTLAWVLLQAAGFLPAPFLVQESPGYCWYDSLLVGVFFSLVYPTCFFLLYFCYFEKLIAASPVAAYVYQHRRFIEIVCGMLANTLAQYYFGAQSLPLILAFLSFAIAWLGSLAIVQPRTDFGIFQFFVSMSAQSAVSLFGLHFRTFLVVLGGIALMVLRWKMESVSLKHIGKQESVVRDWKRLEELNGSCDFFLGLQISQPVEATAV